MNTFLAFCIIFNVILNFFIVWYQWRTLQILVTLFNASIPFRQPIEAKQKSDSGRDFLP